MINKEEIDFDFTSDTTEPDYYNEQEVTSMKKQPSQKKPARKPKIEHLDVSDVDLKPEDFATIEGDPPLKPNERIVKQWTFTN